MGSGRKQYLWNQVVIQESTLRDKQDALEYLCQSPAVMLVHKRFEKLAHLSNAKDLKFHSEGCDFFFIQTVNK